MTHFDQFLDWSLNSSKFHIGPTCSKGEKHDPLNKFYLTDNTIGLTFPNLKCTCIY